MKLQAIPRAKGGKLSSRFSTGTGGKFEPLGGLMRGYSTACTAGEALFEGLGGTPICRSETVCRAAATVSEGGLASGTYCSASVMRFWRTASLWRFFRLETRRRTQRMGISRGIKPNRLSSMESTAYSSDSGAAVCSPRLALMSVSAWRFFKR